MNINWIYFSDTKTSPGDIKPILEKDNFELNTTYQMDKLHSLLRESNQVCSIFKSRFTVQRL